MPLLGTRSLGGVLRAPAEWALLSPFTDVETEIQKLHAQSCILIWGRVWCKHRIFELQATEFCVVSGGGARGQRGSGSGP